jgi:hypothetical protein
MKTIGHHTTENRNNVVEILQKGAFFSAKEGNNTPFLGEGYYFWDDNEEMAHFWGNKMKSDNYYIFSADLHINDNLFLDLVGSRQCQKWLYERAKALEKRDGKQWSVGNLIEYLKNLALLTKNTAIFPFTAIRAIDYSQPKTNQYQIVFSDKEKLKNKYTVINPVYIICILDKNDGSIQSFKHLFP